MPTLNASAITVSARFEKPLMKPPDLTHHSTDRPRGHGQGRELLSPSCRRGALRSCFLVVESGDGAVAVGAE